MNSPIYLDVLHMRRPSLKYVSPAICEALFSSTSFPVLVLNPLPVQNAITGLRITFVGGSYVLNWDDYPGALCYSVYKLNDAADPFGDYTIVAECITDPVYVPEDWEFPFDPENDACYVVSAITLQGEVAVSDPLCNFTPPPPPPPPPVGECYELQTPIGVTGAFAGCYDSTNDRMVFLSGASDIVVVDATTDAVISTTGAGVGFIIGGISFAPSTGLVYFNGHDGVNPVVGVFDAATSTVVGTISVPGTVNFLSGAHTYEAATDRVYIPVSLNNATSDGGLLAVDPVAGTSALLISLSSPPGEQEGFGFRAAYAAVNDRIFIPTFHSDGVTVTVSISVYSSAGALVTTIPIFSPASVGREVIFYNPENSMLYYMGDNSVAGGPGLLILDPADNSTVAAFSSSPDIDSWACFTNGLANIIDNNGDFTQRHSTDHSVFCSQNIAGINFATTMESRLGAKVYIPNFITNQIEVLE